jgi:hypothetical protein
MPFQPLEKDMKILVIYNMERTRLGRWFMEGYPAKFHALPFLGVMTFTGPKERVSEALIKHELIHFYQARREGWLRWNINYYRQLWTVGYMANTYEIEAYARMYYPMTAAEWKLVGMKQRRFTWLPQ